MKERSRLIIESVGVVSVVLSLLIVAYQIRQSNLIARVTTEYEIANNYSEWNQSLYSDLASTENIARLVTQSLDIQDLELKDQIALFSYAGRSMYIWLAAETAYENGMLSEETYLMAMNDIPVAMNMGVRAPSAYRAFIESHPAIINSGVVNRIYDIIGR